MNLYPFVILGALLLEYGMNLLADILNLGTLAGKLPEEFTGMFTPEAYRKAQEYTRVRTLFGIITSTVNLGIILLFWFAGGFNWLDLIVRGLNVNVILTGAIYIAVLLSARAILALPFTIYSTFVIEQRFGFNKTTLRTFVSDRVKGLLLASLLGGPLLAGLLALFEYAGASAWLYCWIAAASFTLFIQFVAPTWIMPLFNKFTPLQPGELRDSILAYASSVRFVLENVFIMDGSKRSSKSNAFFTGFGNHKRIALFDTLVAKHSAAELVAVLAHEIGHYKKKHILKGLALSMLQMGIMFYLLSLFLSERGLFDAFFMEHQSVYAGMLFFGMLYTPIEFIISILMHIFSRHNEFEADRFAVETTRGTQPMIDALKKLSVDNLSHLTPHPLYVFMNYSHPPILERIKAIRTSGKN
ncbi:MAG TPA: M48 family metallopeptidase [Bacteroidota bacterium]|jgi:STE24 endopeptidase